MKDKLEFIYPTWSAPPNIKAVMTTRVGGASNPPYDSLNLGDHVGDDPKHVRRNRAILKESLKLPAEPAWLKQVHGPRVIAAASAKVGEEADGAYTDRAGVVCAILTADCLPIFLCDKNGTKVGLLHAGWRGLVAGVIEVGVQRMGVPEDLLAWLGPAIGPDVYEVGNEVREAFTTKDATVAAAFKASDNGRWLMDLYSLARSRLHALGVREISGGNYCTLRDRERFFSFRRDGATGRMASLIWVEP